MPSIIRKLTIIEKLVKTAGLSISKAKHAIGHFKMSKR